MSANTELTTGVSAMTPEIPNAQVNLPQEQTGINMGVLSRKQSKASIGRSEDLSIPSPPMSPCQSSQLKEDSAPILETKSTKIDEDGDLDLLGTTTPKDQIIVNEVTPAPTDIIVVLKRTGKEYPLSTFQETPLIVNAWNGAGTKTFKNSQLLFLRSYINRSKSYKPSNKNHSRKYAPRRVVKSYYNEVNTSPSNNYNSDSDYNSQFEKVRTRRVARETSSHPTFPTVETTPTKASTSNSVVKKKRPATFSSPSHTPANLDWEAIPDFSPDVSTLPSNPRCLKVEWKGQPMNLSDDPLLDKLHPAEVTLASILRLPCNLYLDSKRRIFNEKVSRLKKNLPFRRTDAQKSCNIDVNKASRLFAAFEKIGWLEDEKFEKFL